MEEHGAAFDCHNDNHMLPLIFNCILQSVGESHTTKNFPVQNFISSPVENHRTHKNMPFKFANVTT